MDHRKNMDEDRIAILEQMLKETNDALMDSEKKFEEVIYVFWFVAFISFIVNTDNPTNVK